MSGAQVALVAGARVVPLVVVAPPLGGRSWLTRALVAGLLMALVWPAVSSAEGSLLLLVARELGVGLVLGLLVAVPFRAAEAGGALLDDAIALAAPGAPPKGRRPFAEAYELLALALFAGLGGPRLVASGLAASYLAFPVGDRPVPAAGIRLVIESGAQLVLSAISLAAPALAALLLSDVVIGFVVRAQPAATQVLAAPPIRLLLAAVALLFGAFATASALTGAGALGDLPSLLAASARSLH